MDDVRERCRWAVAQLAAGHPDLLVVVGADPGPRSASFAPWGVDVPVDIPEPLPLPLLVGAWLSRGHVRSFAAVSPELDAADCSALGAELAAAADRVALLAMGDGSACHTEKAPGYLDPRRRRTTSGSPPHSPRSTPQGCSRSNRPRRKASWSQDGRPGRCSQAPRPELISPLNSPSSRRRTASVTTS